MPQERVRIIFDVMAEKGVRQTWLAQKLSVHRSLLTHYKSGRIAMPEDRIQRAGELLDIPRTVLAPRDDTECVA